MRAGRQVRAGLRVRVGGHARIQQVGEEFAGALASHGSERKSRLTERVRFGRWDGKRVGRKRRLLAPRCPRLRVDQLKINVAQFAERSMRADFCGANGAFENARDLSE